MDFTSFDIMISNRAAFLQCMTSMILRMGCLRGCRDGAGHGSRKIESYKVALGEQVALAGLIDDAEQSAALGSRIGDCPVDLAKFQGTGKASVLNGYDKAEAWSFLLHASSGKRRLMLQFRS